LGVQTGPEYHPRALAAVESTPWEFKPDQNIIPAPANPADWPAFREQLQGWREQTKRRLNYSDVLYREPEFAWAARSFPRGARIGMLTAARARRTSRPSFC